MTTTLHQLPDGSVAPLSNEQWQECQREGFTDRCAAAWWMLHALPNLCGGNRTTLMHDYPQRYEHLLAASAGRVIEVTPSLALIDGYLEIVGMRGDAWNVEVYGDKNDSGEIEQIDHSGQVVITIDSAQGVSKTNSIVLAVDKRDRRPLCCFWDNTILHDDLARVAQWTAGLLKPRRPSPMHHDSVTIICEADGSGRHTAHELTFLGMPHELFFQSKDNNAERCITSAKRHIEARLHSSPLVMQEECDELQRDEKNHLKGRKDCLMMYGVAMVIIDRSPYVTPRDIVADKERKNRMSFATSLADHDASYRRRGARAPWGA